ncbi:hypothetical protein FACS1894199_18790 [Bacteroidia bacterium]|nr:hypothetical protein FACS1894199_18790 [Bacteroidia bacterium]
MAATSSRTTSGSKTYTDTEIAYALSKVNHFIGFMSSTTPPQGIARESNLWYASDNLPTSFPIQVKTFTDGAWSSGTSAYTPDQFDLWARLSNNKGYYWFGNVWNIQDLETDEDTIDLTEEGLAHVKDQTFTITEQTSKFANNTQTSFKGFWQGVMGKINGIITALGTKLPLTGGNLTGPLTVNGKGGLDANGNFVQVIDKTERPTGRTYMGVPTYIRSLGEIHVSRYTNYLYFTVLMNLNNPKIVNYSGYVRINNFTYNLIDSDSYLGLNMILGSSEASIFYEIDAFGDPLPNPLDFNVYINMIEYSHL